MGTASFHGDVRFGVRQVVHLLVFGVGSSHDEFEKYVEMEFEELDRLCGAY